MSTYKNTQKLLSITSGGQRYQFAGTTSAKEVQENTIEVDNSDGFINLYTASKDASSTVGQMKGAKAIAIQNQGPVAS